MKIGVLATRIRDLGEVHDYLATTTLGGRRVAIVELETLEVVRSSRSETVDPEDAGKPLLSLSRTVVSRFGRHRIRALSVNANSKSSRRSRQPGRAKRVPTGVLLIWSWISFVPGIELVESASLDSTISRDPFHRGVIVSCPRAGQIWGSPQMAESLQELQTLGVKWISIHPYAGVRSDGTIRFRPTAEIGYLARAVDLVNSAGMKLFWKPHLAYWGSFQWRGAIDFGDDQQAWRRFFDGYRGFIVDQARFAEGSGSGACCPSASNMRKLLDSRPSGARSLRPSGRYTPARSPTPRTGTAWPRCHSGMPSI